MRIAMTLLALSIALTGAACKKKAADTGGAGSGSGSAMGSADTGSGSAMGSAGTGTGSAMGSGSAAGSADTGAGSGSGAGSAAEGAGSGSDAAAMAHHAGNCPSTVLGSTTKAELKGKTVVLTITATDKDSIAAIQKRTEELLKEKSDGATGAPTHDQKGTHGGGQGICPVYFGEGGKATSKKVAKGEVITITPKDKPEELKATIDGRITKADEWVKANIKPGDQGNMGAVGGGKGDHGSTHAGSGDGKGQDRKGGGGAGTGGGGSKGTGGGSGSGSGTGK